MKTVIDPARSIGAGLGAGITAAGLAALTVALVIDPGITVAARAVCGAFGVLLVGSFGLATLRLFTGSGGVVVDLDKRRLGFGLSRRADTWWLPLEDVTGIHVYATRIRNSDGEQTRTWNAAVGLDDRPPIVVAEHTDYENVLTFARTLSRVTDIAEETSEPELSAGPARDTTTGFSVQRRPSLSMLLGLFGLSLTAVGIVLYVQLTEHPIVGLFFAPLMWLMGVALLGVVIVKRVATEELKHEGGRWTHCFRFRTLRWAERTIHAPCPQWRFRILGLRGARIELAGDDGILLMASGATTRSEDDVSTISRLPARFAMTSQDPPPPCPPPEA